MRSIRKISFIIMGQQSCTYSAPKPNPIEIAEVNLRIHIVKGSTSYSRNLGGKLEIGLNSAHVGILLLH